MSWSALAPIVMEGAALCVGVIGTVEIYKKISTYAKNKWFTPQPPKTRLIPINIFTQDNLTFTDEFKTFLSQSSVKVEVDENNMIQSVQHTLGKYRP